MPDKLGRLRKQAFIGSTPDPSNASKDQSLAFQSEVKMGRAQASVPQNQGHVKRADRARQAKDTLNRAIPDVLKANSRARAGIAAAELIKEPRATPAKEAPQASPSPDEKTHIAIRVRHNDSLTAARDLEARGGRTCVLNMASALRPGGGFLQGATSQEEFLCMRTTLYPSLQDTFYRLPDLGGIFTPDVLVFRDSSPDAQPLAKSAQFYVDVISAGMLRATDAEGASSDSPTHEHSAYNQKDRELVTLMMKSVLRIAQQKGCTKLVLGAWGCGAYGNPVDEIASTWRKVIVGSPAQRRPNKEQWQGIEEVTFAMTQTWMLHYFVRAFEDVLAEDGRPTYPQPSWGTSSEEDDDSSQEHEDEGKQDNEGARDSG